MSGLFRPEAVKHASRRLEGEVVLATPVSRVLLTGLFVGVVFLGLVFSASASYSRKETVSGWITPRAGVIRLTARQPGVISQVHVSEGERVAAGQPIATITLSSVLAAGDSYTVRTENIEAQRTAAAARATAQMALLAAEQAQLEDTRRGLSLELEEMRHRLALQRERMTIARAEVERAERIAAQGFMPRRELESRRSAELAAQQDASTQAAQVLTLQRQIGEVTGRLAAIPLTMNASRAEAASADASLRETATQAELQSTYVLVATVGGRVAAIPLGVGQSAGQGATVAVLTPGAADDLEAELYAPSTAVGFIRPGQEVKIMYRAFPHQKFGMARATVQSVSETILAPQEIAIPGLDLREPVFRIRAVLKDGSVSAYGETIPLRSGMLLDADVVIDRRSLLEWLLDPLYAAGWGR